MERLTKKIGDHIVFPSELVGVELTPDNATMYSLLRRLSDYEDTGLTPEEIKDIVYRFEKFRVVHAMLFDPTGKPICTPARMKELAEADKGGRIRILPKSEDTTCGSCGHFKRIERTRRGTCDIRPFITNKWGHAQPERGTYEPSQSRKCCSIPAARKPRPH